MKIISGSNVSICIIKEIVVVIEYVSMFVSLGLHHFQHLKSYRDLIYCLQHNGQSTVASSRHHHSMTSDLKSDVKQIQKVMIGLSNKSAKWHCGRHTLICKKILIKKT